MENFERLGKEIDKSSPKDPINPESVFHELYDLVEVKVARGESPLTIKGAFDKHAALKFVLMPNFDLFLTTKFHSTIISQENSSFQEIGIEGYFNKNLKGEVKYCIYRNNTPVPQTLKGYISVIGEGPLAELIGYKIQDSLGIKLL